MTTPQPAFGYYDDARYSAQPAYPDMYAPRSAAVAPGHQSDLRRLPPLSTTPALGCDERWASSYPAPAFNASPNTHIRSPPASYPASYTTAYPAANLYGYHHVNDPRSLYGQGSSHVSPPTPPPVSHIGRDVPAVKKKRKRAQLRVLNKTYARTAFPPTSEVYLVNSTRDYLVEHAADHVQQVEGLMASCKRLEYLLRGGVSSQTLRDRIEKLLKTIRTSPALDDLGLQILRGLQGFTQLYFRFCESALMGEDTETTILELRELENVKAAEKDGFKEGVSSDVESQQINDELGKIDKHLERIGETLRRTKDFWEDVDKSFKSASSPRASKQAKDPPSLGELGVERRAEEIQTGLSTIYEAAQQYCSSKKMLKTGNDLIKDAVGLTMKCATIPFDPKSTRKSIPPLTKALRSAVKGYKKLSLQFEKYAQKIYLLFWFAGTTTEEKLGVERSEHWHYAHEYLQSKRLSPCVLPFESAFIGIERQLRGIQTFWLEVTEWTSTL
ncbi:hypothetical protein C8R44DRAFT_976986 [Mycena epipterygia]|nr:hypothetical protein C8R44DRAFT_976986 [Mycena epipterygia]